MKHMKVTDYLTYLMASVEASTDMTLLCSTLLDIPFTWDPKFMTDENRADDALSLRHDYEVKSGRSSYIEGGARVLEVLVALAIRIDDDITGEPGTYNPGPWFDKMLEDLGLSHMTDRYFIKREAIDKVGRWMNREYSCTGEGSLFPLSHFHYDQRGLTIWDQMSAWISENY